MNIVIKLPNNTRDRILTFPLLHGLYKFLSRELEEKDEVLNIHLISLKKDIDVLNLLPFHAYYHELEEEDLKNVFSAHRACVNLRIDKPDFYISASDSFIDASMGKQLGIKSRAGFDLGKNKWLLSKRIEFLTGKHKSTQYFNLIRAFTDQLPAIPSTYSRNMDPIYNDWSDSPYTVINLDLINKEVNPEWHDFINLFKKKRFVFMTQDLPLDKQKEFLASFISKLSKENTYEVFEYASNIAFGKLVSHALAFVTHESYLMHLASYIGAHTFYINIKEDLGLTGPKYFLGEVVDFNLKASSYDQVFDEVYKFIDSKSQVAKTD